MDTETQKHIEAKVIEENYINFHELPSLKQKEIKNIITDTICATLDSLRNETTRG